MNEEDIQPHLEGRALNDVLKDKKLFIVDYRDFDGVQGKENYTVFLFHVETLLYSFTELLKFLVSENFSGNHEKIFLINETTI